jgi:hypothetical protein
LANEFVTFRQGIREGMMNVKNRMAAMVAIALWGALPVAHAQAPYSLKTVESNPVPRAEMLNLWREVALQRCADARKQFNLSREECLQEVGERADACAVSQSSSIPAVVASTQVARDIGRKYLHCALPFYYCKGVEVKTEKEAREQCR